MDSNSRFISRRDAAEILGISNRTIERLEAAGVGPPVYHFAGRRMYSEREVLEWAQAQRANDRVA